MPRVFWLHFIFLLLLILLLLFEDFELELLFEFWGPEFAEQEESRLIFLEKKKRRVLRKIAVLVAIATYIFK